MTQIWSAKNKFKIWLDIEKHACQAQEDLVVIPKGIAKLIESKGNFEIIRIGDIASVTKTPRDPPEEITLLNGQRAVFS